MPQVSIVPLARADLSFAPRRWPFADERRADIDAHFAQLRRDKPDLWNGRVLLLYEHTIADSVLSGTCLETDFASMMSWHHWGWPDATMRSCFGQAALQAADGAFLLAVMASHTMNGGRVYFPSGTPDPRDIVDGRVDLAGSVVRELAEETGLTVADVTPEPGWQAALSGARIAMFKRMRADTPADALRARILAHIAAEPQPELADIRIVRGPDDLDPMMPDFVAAFLRHAWGGVHA